MRTNLKLNSLEIGYLMKPSSHYRILAKKDNFSEQNYIPFFKMFYYYSNKILKIFLVKTSVHNFLMYTLSGRAVPTPLFADYADTEYSRLLKLPIRLWGRLFAKFL